MTKQRDVVAYRRKREGRTNYRKRLALLKSATPRLVIRRSNRYMLLQLVTYAPDGDTVLVTLSSQRLLAQGWSGSAKSVPAAYFAGVLLGRAAKAHGIAHAVVDIGMQRHRAGTRLCAAIKGAIDGGLDVPADEAIFPSSERLAGAHLQDAGKTAAFAAKLGVTLPVADGAASAPTKKPSKPKDAAPAKKPAPAKEA
jgi:large subunit ribosomal protein L18